jgi:hypothetical protein
MTKEIEVVKVPVVSVKLIPDFKTAYKFLSLQLITVITVLAGLQAYVPEMVLWLPPNWVPYATALVGVARVVKFGIDTIKEKNVTPD